MTNKKNNNAIEIRRLSKTYISDAGTRVPALKNIDVTIKQGQFVTIIGATGCGKTTLLNLIAGLDRADSGTVELSANRSTERGIAYVFQHYTLFPWRSVLRNVTFGLQMGHKRFRQRNKIARKLIDQVGLTGFESSYPHELSGGMRQRTALAQALAIGPEILLLDEPFGALDDSTRQELQEMMINLWRENKLTVLFVTHNIDEALVMGDRVLVFTERPGRISKNIAIDLPRPRNRLSKEFTDYFMDIRKALSGQTE